MLTVLEPVEEPLWPGGEPAGVSTRGVEEKVALKSSVMSSLGQGGWDCFCPLLSPQPPTAAFPSSLSHSSWAREEGHYGHRCTVGESANRVGTAFSSHFHCHKRYRGGKFCRASRLARPGATLSNPFLPVRKRS